MSELWYGLLCLTLIAFAVLDGWNIGAGALHLVIAKTRDERRQIIAALGPLWSWHEVWLIAAGGTFLLAFPTVMSVAFSGFYLALWLVLWSLVLRGISIEVGGHLSDPMWQSFWDALLATSSVTLAALFGAVVGNVIRGVPLDTTGRFMLTLFTDFTARGHVGLLDWYTIAVAIFAVVVLSAHGATYLAFRTEGDLRHRSLRLSRSLWIVAAALFAIVTIGTAIVRPELFANMRARPIAWFFVLLLLTGTWAIWHGLRRGRDERAFAGSGAVIVSLLGGVAASIFPVMLHSTLDSRYSMTAYAGATSEHALTIALVWWPIAATLALTYVLVVATRFRGRVTAGD